MPTYETFRDLAPLLREHLVNTSIIAERVGVRVSAVTNWGKRYPAFEALVIVRLNSGPLWFWPEVDAWLDEEGIRRVHQRASYHPLPDVK